MSVWIEEFWNQRILLEIFSSEVVWFLELSIKQISDILFSWKGWTSYNGYGENEFSKGVMCFYIFLKPKAIEMGTRLINK